MSNLKIEINCRDCKYFDKNRKDCSIEDGSPIRKCVIAINKNLAEEIFQRESKLKLLDIGCGRWAYIKNNLPGNLKWEGIDIKKIDKKGRETIATRIGSVEDIPFRSDEFDYVLANQSIEHWFEYGVTFKKALAEISRVLKKDGRAIINVPIHLHGHKIFLEGNKKKIEKLFNKKFWEIERTEEWRKNPEPLKKYRRWKETASTNCLSKKYNNKTSHILNIVLKKEGSLRTFFG